MIVLPGMARFWARKGSSFGFSRQFLINIVVDAVVDIDAFVVVRTTLAIRPYLVPAVDPFVISKTGIVDLSKRMVDLESAKSYIRSGLMEDDMNRSARNVVTLGFIKILKGCLES